MWVVVHDWVVQGLSGVLYEPKETGHVAELDVAATSGQCPGIVAGSTWHLVRE